ncbi:MAG: hypothetical protein H3C31_12955 [Brumimicrobium sp.]|nr:hypothetical protein [Brumimicrobium sp.]
MKNIDSICLIVDGWGGLAAFKSILNGDIPKIELITNDLELISLSQNNNRIILKDINEIESKLIVCAGYKKIISKELLKSKEFINIHYSLLPKYRGFHSTVWAILNEEAELGLSIHRMNEFIDDGPIIEQYKVSNDGKSTSNFYMSHFNNWIENNLNTIIHNYFHGEIIEKEQDKSRATWVGKRNVEDCKLNFNDTNRYLNNMFRALVDPYPLPFIRMRKSKEEFRITKFELIQRTINTHIGRILNIDNEGLYVCTKEGYIILKELIDVNNNVVMFNHFKIGQYLEL